MIWPWTISMPPKPHGLASTQSTMASVRRRKTSKSNSLMHAPGKCVRKAAIQSSVCWTCFVHTQFAGQALSCGE